MSDNNHLVVAEHEISRGTTKSYTIGFLVSVVLTIGAYLLVVNHVWSGWALVFALVALAVIQLFVQLVFFLHLSAKSHARWNLFVFLFMLLVVLIVVIGSLWIMHNLNYRMTPEQVRTYLNSQDSL